MDQQNSGQQQQPVIGVVSGATQMPYGTSPYQTTQMVAPVPPASVVGTVQSPAQAAPGYAPQLTASHLAYQHLHQQQQQQQQQQLQVFWNSQLQDIEQTTDFKNHSLPLARIKKIMKADEDVRMISAEAPVIFAKACEMFILELTLRSWIHTEENKRRTLQKNDIAAAITRTDIFDFLVDIVPRDELKEEGLAIPRVPVPGTPAEMPYYYVSQQHPPSVPPTGMIVGKPVDPAMYAQQPRPPVAYMPQQMWPQQQQMPEQSRGQSSSG